MKIQKISAIFWFGICADSKIIVMYTWVITVFFKYSTCTPMPVSIVYIQDLFSSTNLTITMSVFIIIQAVYLERNKLLMLTFKDWNHFLKKHTKLFHGCAIQSCPWLFTANHCMLHPILSIPCMGSVVQKIALSTR